ncbi:hypothetical protein KVR01_006887 [Diaporthe batatas]|uniref:uncharacterized protein n=1 Tax=Diaporthe batatas TaxID=748121 RepID=UPI001D057643|nr:uncharacterized protein KVR01_006887 [Diaporthe batatas]KAG8163590.1 hypothetical protein KVR01_006887 [Diaporthe batatas]
MLWPQEAVDPEIFPPMDSVPGAGDPVVFGPSWDFGDPPEDFEYLFNPASSVFGAFLPFSCSPPFTMEPPATLVTSGSKVGVVMPQPQPEPQPEPHMDAPTVEVDTPPGSDTTARHPRLTVRETGEDDFWILPKDVEHWTMFQCCPTPSSVSPGRATAHLSFLEESSRLRNSAGPWSLPTRGSTEPVGSNVSLSASTRERLSAITQTFFPRALEMHGMASASASSLNRNASEWFGSSGFILLPPTADLDIFLETYIRCVEPFYPLVPTHTLDPNDLLGASGNEKGAVLLLLLMMAIGASCNRATRARRFGAGLAEVCRIALTDLVEKDNQYSTVPLILQCSLLLTIQSCWGGEKWQMDIGAGHRFITFSGMRSPLIDAQVSTPRGGNGLSRKAGEGKFDPTIKSRATLSTQALTKASKSRLAYDWVMLDQELSLFYDQPPTFAITELRAPLPEIDALWLAKSADEWRALCHSENASRPQYSLRQVFQLCLANEINLDSYHLTPTRLRLLLYPIQSLVFHHSQLLDAVPDKQIRASSSFKTTTRTSSLLRFEELQNLLQNWWALAQQCQHRAPAVTADPGQPLTPPPSESDQVLPSANFLLFHLISLNLYADLKAIEGLARGEDPSCSAGSSSDEAEYIGGSGAGGHHAISLRTRQRHIAAQCVFAPHDALYHAGQVLRLVRETALSRRPPWWGAAVYRAALVLWAYASMQQCSSSSSSSSPPPPSSPPSREKDSSGRGKQVLIAIDSVLPGDPAVERFLRQGKGLPVLLNGGAVTMRVDREPGRVLGACIALLDADEGNTWFTTGVRIKLETLQQAWSTTRLGQGNIVQ